MPEEFVPIRLPRIWVPLTEPPESSIPAVMLPEMIFAAPVAVPPITLPAPPSMSTPMSFPRAICPDESVPIKLPSKTLPVASAPVISTPAALFWLMTLPAPGVLPPIVFDPLPIFKPTALPRFMLDALVPNELPRMTLAVAPAPVVASPDEVLKPNTFAAPAVVPPIVFPELPIKTPIGFPRL